jgi:hypothetical protein
MTITLQLAAKLALDVQNACNASGVIHTLAEQVLLVVWEHARERGRGTDYVNTHPIVTLFLYKLTALNSGECLCNYTSIRYEIAKRKCKAIAEGRDPDKENYFASMLMLTSNDGGAQ